LSTKELIYSKLESFIKKYYTNECIRGSIFFVGLGLLYFLLTLLLEHFLWLSTTGRTLLFWFFILVMTVLLLRFILFPLFKLFRLQKGITYDDASKIIGSHFCEIDDKLTNFLQLSKSPEQSELLMASIDQKAQSLQPIPFTRAVDFKKNIKYLPWAVIPILFFLFFFISGRTDIIKDSMNRVVQYNQKFSPPAPFTIMINNPVLQTEQGQDFILQIKAEGRIVPESAMIVLGDESYFMESVRPGVFEYRFVRPLKTTQFYIQAQQVQTPDYQLKVIEVPTIATFEMKLVFPSYLNRPAETVRGTGNAIIPEGTKVLWNIAASATDEIVWKSDDKTVPFQLGSNGFELSQSIPQTTLYEIRTSNKNVKDYEKLQYQLNVIKDQFPSIQVSTAPDSLNLKQQVLIGQVADDYGLSKLQIVYYPKGNEAAAKKSLLNVKKEVYDRFVFMFPGNLPLEEGVSYDYYFEIFDNDARNGFKSTRSSVFSDRLLTQDEKEDQLLQDKNNNLNSLQKSIKNQDKQLSELEKLQKMGKEKNELEFKDRQKINDFIKRQKQQEQMMKEFSKKLEDNLKEFKTERNDPNKEMLQERLNNAEKEADRNEKLLEELQRLSDKMQEEDLFDKMDQFKQSSKNQMKNLEQLVELTKRYYVEKKAEQLANKLDQLGDKQEKLADDNKKNTVENQGDLNKEFDKLQDELRQLEKDNKDLKSPMDIPSDEKQEQSIEEDMKKATDDLKQQNQNAAKPKQKSAGQKMKQMGQQMMSSMGGGEMEQLQEDVKMLRQILDNLLAYSFAQEDVMKQFKGLKRGSPSYNKHLKRQQDLKVQFRHVDDSLFALSMRNPMLTERVTEEIGNVHYNVDKSLETLAEAMISKGTSHQQYAVAASNRLADMLSDILNNMQMQMSGSGSGGKGMPKPGQGKGGAQLPDIIQKQKGLADKMKEGMEKGPKEGGEQPGDKGKPKGSQPGGEGQGGNGSGDGEENARELMEIYKEQRRLREQLQDALQKQGLSPDGKKLLDQMKDAEKQIINKGFKNEVLQKVLNIQYEMLKLEKALQQQGEDNKRQSETNTKDFQNNATVLPASLQQYLNSIEILNRQSLPLRPQYQQRVQQYFKSND
jgi:hypothetical protein